jgi:4-hydroxy-2-oxoheptanedioate aldolase
MRSNTVKHALRQDRPQVGTWLSLGSPMAARFMARAGFHWLTVDLEHSPIDIQDAATIFGQVADAGGIPLARVPSNTHENVKRVLDAGAFGVVFPMCNTREDAERAVAACKYAPEGNRSVGGGMHALNFATSPAEYYARANEEILVVVQIEHVDAVARCEQILSVPGIDACFVGPNDLLSSMHRTPAMETDEPEFVEAMRTVISTARKCGVAPGLHVGDAAMAKRRIAEGWRFVAISSELGFMQGRAEQVVAEVIGGAGGETVRY